MVKTPSAMLKTEAEGAAAPLTAAVTDAANPAGTACTVCVASSRASPAAEGATP